MSYVVTAGKQEIFVILLQSMLKKDVLYNYVYKVGITQKRSNKGSMELGATGAIIKIL